MIGEWLKGGLAYFFLYFSSFFIFFKGVGGEVARKECLKVALEGHVDSSIIGDWILQKGRERNGPGGEWKRTDKEINAINGEG